MHFTPKRKIVPLTESAMRSSDIQVEMSLTRAGPEERAGLEIDPWCPQPMGGMLSPGADDTPRKRGQSKETGLPMTKPLGLVEEEKPAQIPRGGSQGNEKKIRSMK